MIGAHYYPWYGKPSNLILGGGNWESGTAHTPVLGTYSSDDDNIIKEHVLMAKRAGIDFFILEWTGPSLKEDRTIREHCIPVFESMNMPFCVMYDSYFTLQKTEINQNWDLSSKYDCRLTKGMKMLEDFEYLSGTFFSHPLYVTIHQQPIVFVFLAYKLQDNDGFLKRLRTLKGVPINGLFLIGDMVPAYACVSKPSIADILYYLKNMSLSTFFMKFAQIRSFRSVSSSPITAEFDALSGYNLLNYHNNIIEKYDSIIKNLIKNAKHYQKNWIPFIFPGYDDRNLRGINREKYVIEREKNGTLFFELFKKALINIDPELKMVIITSFNEWHEGTEIEPSKEYKDLYLNINQDFVKSFKRMETKVVYDY